MDEQDKASLSLDVYERVYRHLLNNPILKFNAGQITAGTLQSNALSGGTPVTMFNLDTGVLRTTNATFAGTVVVGVSNIIIDGLNKRIVINDGVTNRVVLGFASGLF